MPSIRNVFVSTIFLFIFSISFADSMCADYTCPPIQRPTYSRAEGQCVCVGLLLPQPN